VKNLKKHRHRIRVLFLIIFLICLIGSIFGYTEEKPPAQAPVFIIDVESIITPPSVRFMTDSIDEAAQNGAQLLIIQLDTPGGMLESTRDLVKKLLASPIPVAVYVAPAGACAASAGVFITIAANIAVMAPSTHIGAAHPVNLGGGKEGETMAEKIVNDTVAFVRNIAKARGKNGDWAEKAVRKSVSITEDEAVKLNVIDFISPSVDDILAKIDGKTIKLEGGKTVTLATKGVKPKPLQMSFRYRILEIISHPNIAYILLMLGMMGVYFEFSNPGAILPGVVGGIFLILAFYAMQMLPVNYAGLALILFAAILFIAEIKVMSHGLLAIGGVVSLLLGSLMLFGGSPEYMKISITVIIPVVVVSAAFFIFAVTMAIKARIKKPTTGKEGMIGEKGIAATALAPEGKVSLHGEYWNASSDTPIEEGEKIEVIAVENLKLKVKRTE
jgi:membrane-bound serine protease (ClpP class)